MCIVMAWMDQSASDSSGFFNIFKQCILTVFFNRSYLRQVYKWETIAHAWYFYLLGIVIFAVPFKCPRNTCHDATTMLMSLLCWEYQWWSVLHSNRWATDSKYEVEIVLHIVFAYKIPNEPRFKVAGPNNQIKSVGNTQQQCFIDFINGTAK